MRARGDVRLGRWLFEPRLQEPQVYKAAGTKLYPVAIADINGDGRQDIVVGSEKNKTVSILYGKKHRGFTGPHNYAAGPYPFWISIADFNHDHSPDIAVASDRILGKVVVLLSRRGGGYKSHSYTVGIDPYAMAVADFNRDGNPDLVVANDGSTFASILLGRHNAPSTTQLANQPGQTRWASWPMTSTATARPTSRS